MKKKIAIDRIVPQIEEQKAYDPTLVPITYFEEAYDKLRREAPVGNLHIHLFVIVEDKKDS